MKKSYLKLLYIFSLLILVLNITGCKKEETEKKGLSIIVPVYNVEEYLPKCLDSLVNQTYKNIEIICIDDGSTDNSLKILKDYSNNDERIIILEQENSGVSAARNRGLDVARGEYVAFVDADDYIDVYAYENCINIMNENSMDILAFNHFVEPEHRKIDDYSDYEHYNSYDCFKNIFHVNGYVFNKIFRRSIIEKNGVRFAEDVVLMEDNLFLKMVFPHTERIYGCSTPFYHYVQRDNSAVHSNSNEKWIIESIKCRKYLVDYYINNLIIDRYIDMPYNGIYQDLLHYCLEVVDRIRNLSDDSKKSFYSKQLLEIIDTKLMDKIGDVIYEDKNMFDDLRSYSRLRSY